MNDELNLVQRVIGLDAHPDSFTAAVLQGATPAAAVVEKVFNKIPLQQLQRWAQKHTTAKDLLVLEASGNSFQIVRTLRAVARQALVLESCHLGKLKEAHANNDQISAVRIGKAHLAGTAKVVWVPDARTQERRDWFHAHRKATKRTTQMKARLRSYLSDNGVRLNQRTNLLKAQAEIRAAHPWSPRQWQVVAGFLMELRHAEEQRQHWRRLIAQEVLTDPDLLALVRLCGVREMVAFGCAAFIGDIQRFSEPKKLVKYIGLNPRFDNSGQTQWTGGVGGAGQKDLRNLLVEAAQAILAHARNALAQWGRKLRARKSVLNLAVCAVARKLAVSIWYLLMGRWTPLQELDAALQIKISKLIAQVGAPGLQALHKTRAAFRQEICARLKAGPTYGWAFDPTEATPPLTHEYGLR